MTRIARGAATLAIAVLCMGGFARAQDVKVSGQFDGGKDPSPSPPCTVDCSGFEVHGTFDCTGMPVCVGTYTARAREGHCSNFVTLSNQWVMNGLDLSRPGPIQGTITLV